MFRTIRQFFAALQPPRQSDDRSQQHGETLETTLVYVRVKPETKPAGVSRVEESRLASPPSVPLVASALVTAGPAVRQSKPAGLKPTKAVGTPLTDLGIFSTRQVTLLRQIGCRTDRELLRLTPQRLGKRLADFCSAQQHSPDAPLAPPIDRIRSLVRRGRWAIRFANHFGDMTPRESMLLRAVHRGSRQNLSRDSAGMIRRDLQRLALSSRGKRLVTLDQIPKLHRIQNWIVTARDGKKPASKNYANRLAMFVTSPSEDSQTDVPMVPR